MIKRLLQMTMLLVSMLMVACSSSSTSDTQTVASYTGTYIGSSSGVNAGPTTVIVSADNTIKGTFSITNRLTNETGTGVPTVYETTLDGKVDSAGKVSFNSIMDGTVVMVFSGSINANGLMSGTYFEPAHPNDPSKAGTFSVQGPANGSTTTSGGSAKSCTGSFVGTYDMPSHEERIRLRNLSLAGRGIPVTGNDDIDNANAGGGGVDGGIYMQGSYQFETDASCNVVKGTTMIFYVYQYDISGKVNADGSFALTWSGQGSVGELSGKASANNVISGEFHHGAPDSFVYGVMSGTFTPNGKI